MKRGKRKGCSRERSREALLMGGAPIETKKGEKKTDLNEEKKRTFKARTERYFSPKPKGLANNQSCVGKGG